MAGDDAQDPVAAIEAMRAKAARLRTVRRAGAVAAVDTGSILIEGLVHHARLGDRIEVTPADGPAMHGEIVALADGVARAMIFGATDGLSIGARVILEPEGGVRPDESWAGRLIDAFGEPLDGRPLPVGPVRARLRQPPPPAADRRRIGARLATGLAAFDTMLPL
ncbi:MAG: flagellum-specific ATP synthase FliI, partial [Pseudomonadota bacterium]